jgi:hypothetical protein
MRTALFRRILWAAAAFNVLGACLLGFPASTPGQLTGLPAEVPLAYRAIASAFVLLFAGTYAWLALQPQPDRPMVVLGAVGKGTIFVIAMALWLAAEASLNSLVAAGGDLLFAAAFLWWLVRSKSDA